MKTKRKERRKCRSWFYFFIPVADIQSHQDFLEAVTYFIPGNVEYHAILLICLNGNLLVKHYDGKNIPQDAHRTKDDCQNGYHTSKLEKKLK